MLKNKVAILLVAILLFTMSSTMFFMPTSTAHSPPWSFPSYSYIVVAPDPVGVGQKVAVSMWADYPLPGAVVTNNIRRQDYTLTIAAPDGTITKQHWDVIADPTGIQSFTFTPDKVGIYNLTFVYGGQTYTWDQTNTPGLSSTNAAYENDTYAGSSQKTSLTVQQTQLPNPITSYPLPTEYWTHPIEGQNTDWWTISSNWLGSPQIVNRFQPYGSAPNSAHVMWSKQIQEGGVVGGMMGDSVNDPVRTFYMGGSYNVRWSNPLIMNGKIYYELPYGNSGSGGGYVADDLRTGQEIWRINTTATGVNLVPSFGFLYAFDDGNQHGVLPNGLLIASGGGGPFGGGGATYWVAYDPDTGVLTSMNWTNIPSGTSVQGNNGEILRYSITNCGTPAKPDWYLAQWNSTKLISSPTSLGPVGWYTRSLNANVPITPARPTTTLPGGNVWNWNGSMWVSTPSSLATSTAPSYDWNISLTQLNQQMFSSSISWSINSQAAYGHGMLLTQGSFGGRSDNYYGGNWYGANVTYINLDPTGKMGQVLWSKYFPPASGNVTRSLVAVDYDTGIFIFEDQETLVHWGYNLADGSYAWGPTAPADQYDYFRSTTRVAYGNFYYAGYGGILYAYDDKTGQLKWTYGNGGPGNSTSSGLGTAWGHYPLFMPAVADGKIFLDSTEHSPGSPFYKGELVRAINATDGTEIWTLEGWGTGMDANYDIAADGFYAYLNCYDMKVYVIGKGPSTMTVDAPSNSIKLGDSLVIRGTVTDIAAGTKQDEQIARFPNGVPAVSDASQKAWMEYVYMQKPRPTDVTGVPVTINVVDANGNFRQIGTAISDANGYYALPWKPDISGQYYVYASFGGSESYWPSHAETSFIVDQAAATPSPQAQLVLPPTEMYITAGVIAIIVAIVIVGAVNLIAIRKRA